MAVKMPPGREGRVSGLETGLAARWNKEHRWVRIGRKGLRKVHCLECGMSVEEAMALGVVLCPGGYHTMRGRWLLQGLPEQVVLEEPCCTRH